MAAPPADEAAEDPEDVDFSGESNAWSGGEDEGEGEGRGLAGDAGKAAAETKSEGSQLVSPQADDVKATSVQSGEAAASKVKRGPKSLDQSLDQTVQQEKERNATIQSEVQDEKQKALLANFAVYSLMPDAELDRVLPRMGNDTRTSIGTVLHASQKCTPCNFEVAGATCKQGVRCRYCHAPHERPATPNGKKKALARKERQKKKKERQAELAQVGSEGVQEEGQRMARRWRAERAEAPDEPTDESLLDRDGSSRPCWLRGDREASRASFFPRHATPTSTQLALLPPGHSAGHGSSVPSWQQLAYEHAPPVALAPHDHGGYHQGAYGQSGCSQGGAYAQGSGYGHGGYGQIGYSLGGHAPDYQRSADPGYGHAFGHPAQPAVEAASSRQLAPPALLDVQHSPRSTPGGGGDPYAQAAPAAHGADPYAPPTTPDPYAQSSHGALPPAAAAGPPHGHAEGAPALMGAAHHASAPAPVYGAAPVNGREAHGPYGDRLHGGQPYGGRHYGDPYGDPHAGVRY